MVKRFFLITVLLLSVITAYCQYHVSGNNDSRIKYRQIKTEKFHIVYPDYYENNAQLLASVLDTVVPVIGNSLKTSAPNVPILIHTKSSISNGLSVWAPKRMEFWTTPPPTSYAFPYTWQLAIHEYRHTAQMQSVNVGITKVFSTLFGEHILGGVAGLLVPDWFFEGDAVVAETALAPAGRGQEPDYNMFLKAQVIDKGRYSVDKMLLGSMKDFVVDEYNLGYFLVSYGRQKYGRDIWGDCLHHVGTSWWKLTSWGKTNRGQENLDFKTMYNEALDSLEKVWIDNDIHYTKQEGNQIVKYWGEDNKQDYVNYKNPVQINDSTVLALKTSSYQTQSLVKIINNREEHLLSLPFLLHSYFQYRDGHILYSQYSPNIRWQQEAASDIIDYDLNRNKFVSVTSKTTFFTPIYYPNDSLIAAVYTDSLDNQNLAFIAPDTAYFKNKNILKKNNSSYVRVINGENNMSYSYPIWQDSTSNVYFIETSAYGKRIICYDVTSAERKTVTDYSFDNIKYLKIHNDRLYFTKDVNNKYQMLSIALNDYNDVQIHTDSRYGIDNFFLYDSTILVSDYTADGFRLVSMKYKADKYDINRKNTEMYFTKLNREQENFILCDSIINKNKTYNSREYKKVKHLFKFHSWAPLFINIQSKELGVGVSAFSQNLLSSSVLEFGYKHNFHDKEELFMRYTYSGLYPIMTMTTSYRPRSLRQDLDSNLVKYIDWDEITLGYDITLPFSWTNRNYRNNINLTLHYSLNSISDPDNDVRLNVFNSIGYYAQVSNYCAMANNDLYPRTGHITNIKYTHTLTSTFANIFSFQSQVFAPGLARNHSFVLTGSFQKNSPDVYYFQNEVNFVRGVYNKYPEYFAGILAQYCFPLLYPDNGISGILYLKRIVAKPFINHGWYDKQHYYSYGSDIEAKVHLFRITIPVNIGLRIGYCPVNDDTFASFLFSIDL
ncbi:MAG: hypothetical protein IJ759_01830 [Bacteroidales bacterium]|nr:hypothetical protein [Bacteroidales bacterium]